MAMVTLSHRGGVRGKGRREVGGDPEWVEGRGGRGVAGGGEGGWVRGRGSEYTSRPHSVFLRLALVDNKVSTAGRNY